jgi:hypothetical protein
VLSWRTEEIASFDLGRPFTAQTAGPVLLVTVCPDIARLRAHVSIVASLGLVRTGEGTGGPRGFRAFKLTGLADPLPPLATCRSLGG